jgi:hypothetical protein
MKIFALFIAFIALIVSPLTLAGGSEAESIAQLKAQIAELSKRLDNMDKYTTVVAKKTNPKLKWAEKINIKGDMRYRYETMDDDRENVGDADERNRSRLRARLEVTAQVSDDVKAGFALATGTSGGDPISSNSTFGSSNSDKGIVLDQGYIAWKFYENMTLTAGKTKVPYFKPGKSSLIFDGDLRPEGAHIKYKNNSVFATLGYNFLNSDDGSSGNKDIIETYGAQVGYKFKLDKNTKVTVGLGYYNIPLSGSELADVLADEFGNTVSGTTYAYDYEIQQVFAEVKTKILGQKSTFYADYIKNDGDSDIDGISDLKEDTGFVYGVKVGSAKRRGDLAFGYAYQDLEQDATFGAHTDSDFGGGGTDTKGSKISGALGLSKNTSLALTYFDTEYGKESRGEEFDYERLQVDLKTKF